jgi:hypothetical protein
MHRCTLLILFLFASFIANAQQDFLQLKKGNRTVKTYFKGSYLTFQSENYQWLTGRIHKVTNDSVYLYQIDVRMMPNAWGLGSIADTTVLGVVPLSMKNIRAIPNERRAFITKIGSIMQIGAGGYVALNFINAGLNKEPLFDDRNLKRLAGAGIAFVAGTLFKLTDPDIYKLGKKYKLVYVKLTP